MDSKEMVELCLKHTLFSWSATGTVDPRRLPNEPGMAGIVRVMDPWPYDYSFGKNDDEIVKNNLQYIEEVIQYEGTDKIAAMFIETVTGTNGILPPPKAYLAGLKA